MITSWAWPLAKSILLISVFNSHLSKPTSRKNLTPPVITENRNFRFGVNLTIPYLLGYKTRVEGFLPKQPKNLDFWDCFVLQQFYAKQILDIRVTVFLNYIFHFFLKTKCYELFLLENEAESSIKYYFMACKMLSHVCSRPPAREIIMWDIRWWDQNVKHQHVRSQHEASACERSQCKTSLTEIIKWDTLMCVSIGTPKNNKFSICSKWKIHYFQVSQILGIVQPRYNVIEFWDT